MTLQERWIYALKPASWPKLLVAALLGQATGIAATGTVDLWGLLAGAGFTVSLLAAIVLLNDWGDREIDGLKRRMFPEMGSPKTIPDAILEPRSVAWAGLGAAAVAAGMGVAAQELLGRPGLGWGGLVCVAIFACYTFPPARLNYRGGGELLEMLGVGFALPWYNAYAQSGLAVPAGTVLLPGFALLCLASALASGLVDEQSDRLGGKRTFVTMFGALAVRQGVEGLVLGGMLVWSILPRLAPGYATFWMVIPCVALMTVEYRALRRVGAAAHVESYDGLREYKGHLHRCIWRGTVTLAATVALTGILGGGLGSMG